MSTIHAIRNGRTTSRGNKALWAVQVLLALVFLFAGGMKLAMPAATLAQFTGLPGGLMKFIGVAEFSGALGLVLPGLFAIKRLLTPIAAVGLVTIMSGAVVLTVGTGQVAGALVPFIVGSLAILVARKRWSWLVGEPAAGRPTLEIRAAAAA